MRPTKLLIGLALVTVALSPLAIGQADAQATQTLDLHCNITRDGIDSFESWYAHQKRDSKTGCWAHFGHNHYFVGRDNVYALHGGTVRISSTEAELSPMTEPGDPAFPPQWSMPIEVSMDGTDWQQVDAVNWDFFESDWQVRFSFDADGEHFRYIRIRQPTSAAQGLSGYLDKSEFTLDVSVVEQVTEPALAQGTIDRSCESDIMESIFETHPCWFGGVNRWDAPSFFHTYPLGGLAEIDGVEGSVLTNNFRIGPFDAELIPDTDADVFVQTSVNGSSWETVHAFPVTHGEETSFSADLDATEEDARFVRFATSRHPLWTDESEPAAKHPEGYFLDSELSVTGLVPDG